MIRKLLLKVEQKEGKEEEVIRMVLLKVENNEFTTHDIKSVWKHNCEEMPTGFTIEIVELEAISSTSVRITWRFIADTRFTEGFYIR